MEALPSEILRSPLLFVLLVLVVVLKEVVTAGLSSLAALVVFFMVPMEGLAADEEEMALKKSTIHRKETKFSVSTATTAISTVA